MTYKAIWDQEIKVWKVTNVKTKAVQSGWHKQILAAETASALNKGFKNARNK